MILEDAQKLEAETSQKMEIKIELLVYQPSDMTLKSHKNKVWQIPMYFSIFI
jgi:hypothetical protein